MSRIINYLIYSLAAVVVLILLLVVIMVFAINPNDFRDDISRIARDTAGVELKLEGDLSWRFYPVLGFGARDVELALQPGLPSLLKLETVTLGVKLLPLFSQKIEIDALDVGGMQAELLVNEKGEANWQVPDQDRSETPRSESEPSSPSAVPELLIPSLRVHDSHIRYQDKKAGLAYNVDLPLLELTDVNLKQSFPLLLQLRVRDQASLDVTSQLRGRVNLRPDSGFYELADMNLTAELGGIFAKPVDVELRGVVQFDQKSDKAVVSMQQLQFANLLAQGEVAASQLTGDLAFSGKFQTQVFDGKALMTALGVAPPPMRDIHALTKLQLGSQLAGSANSLVLKPFAVNVDGATLSGEVAVVDLKKQALRFALQLDQIDIDRYLPPESKAPVAVAGGPAGSNEVVELIPVETLRSLNVKGTFKAGEVIVNKIPMTDLGLSISASDGELHVDNIGASLLQGSLVGGVTVDARTSQPKINTDIRLTDIELSQLLQPYVQTELLSGKSSLILDTRTEGNDVDTLIKQALGQVNLTLAGAVLHGININQVALDAVKTKLGDFTLLYPDYQQKLPQTLRSDTEISELLANIKMEKGHLLMPDFAAETSEGSLSASGDIDVLQQAFDYRFGVVLTALDGNKYLKGVRWPVHCKGSLSSPVSDWCRPDSKAFDKVLEQAATQALRDKATKKLGKELGVEKVDETAVQEELRDKAKDEEDQLKEKLKGSLNKKLNKLFN